MSYLFTAALGFVLVTATVVGIVTASNHSPRPEIGQSNPGVVLYGGR